MNQPKKVAAVVTEYRRNSHADVIVGKMLEGYNHDGKERPNLRVVSMFVDQFGDKDLSRDLAKKYDVKLCDTIADALTLGGQTLAVEGVVCVGEHGKYPINPKGQTLYPRRRFFEAVTDTFARTKKSVPVFSDKHLSASWDDAKWMVDRARELFVPFLAGSSLPVTWRRPELKLPRNAPLTDAVQIGYGPMEAYGFHALESLQCMVERRKGGETGVQAVTCLQGEEMWKTLDAGKWSKACLEAAMATVPEARDVRERTKPPKDAAVFLIEYRDSFTAAVAMLNGWVTDNNGFLFAGQLKGQDKAVACQFLLQHTPPFGHFAHLVRAIESLIQTGHAPYPVERTLLTTGILDAILTSKAEKNRRVETPHLKIAYQPMDYAFATGEMPPAIKR